MNVIAVPLIEKKVQAWKAWVRECQGPRREEFEAFNERMELTLHRAWLTKGREGPLVIVVYDGPGANTFLQRLANSKEPFDKWFRERISEYHAIDFSKPSVAPSAEIYMDWSVPNYAEVGR
jgi:hypothetical protein